MMIMIRYDRLRDSTSKLPLENNKRIIYISIAHFTQSKFGCLPSQNRIRLEFQKTVILKILFRKTALEKRRECISFLASKAACLFVCEKSKLLMDLSKSHPLLLSISVFQSSSSSFPIFFSLGKRRWKSCHYSQFVQIRGSQFQIGNQTSSKIPFQMCGKNKPYSQSEWLILFDRAAQDKAKQEKNNITKVVPEALYQLMVDKYENQEISILSSKNQIFFKQNQDFFTKYFQDSLCSMREN